MEAMSGAHHRSDFHDIVIGSFHQTILEAWDHLQQHIKHRMFTPLPASKVTISD
jgi:hypothetical protein